jgi:hypothetical protein
MRGVLFVVAVSEVEERDERFGHVGFFLLGQRLLAESYV